MGTMLSYIFTDANVDGTLLKVYLLMQRRTASIQSRLMANLTSDTVMLISTNEASYGHDQQEMIRELICSGMFLNDVATDLAKQIVQDGEGATKFVEIIVSGAKNKDIATTQNQLQIRLLSKQQFMGKIKLGKSNCSNWEILRGDKS